MIRTIRFQEPARLLHEVQIGLVARIEYLIEWKVARRGSTLTYHESADGTPLLVLLNQERVFWPHLSVYRSNRENQQTLAFLAIAQYELEREPFGVTRVRPLAHLIQPAALIRMPPGHDPFIPTLWRREHG